MKIVQTPIAEISFNETESILHIKVFEGAEMNLENAKIHYNEIKKLLGNKRYLALVDTTNYYTIKKEAWEYASSKEIVSNRIAVAHYNSCFANRLTTNFFKTAFHAAMPFEIFGTKEEAVQWLKSFLGQSITALN